MKNRAVYPGSFDPTTYGHIDIIKRSAEIFDELVVAVIANPNKKSLFSSVERIEMLESSIKTKNVKVKSFDGLLVNFMKIERAAVIVRGLRAVTDFEYEFQMALTNRKICPEIETVFLAADERWTYVSSSLVKEIAFLGGDISGFVPHSVMKKIREEIKSK